MVSRTDSLDAAAVLASARRARAEANAAEARVLADAVTWAHLHQVADLDDAATWLTGRGQDTGIPIAPGCPLVSEFAVCEFATALGLSQTSGRHLVGQALELAHRLPKLWARVQAGSLAPWRARRIAEDTLSLSEEAAGFVDAQVARFAHKTGPAQTQRLVAEAIGRFMPDHAAEQRERAAEQRYFAVEHDQVSFAGTSRVHGELDLADALDLEDAIRAGAEPLKTLGSTETLDVRRSLAAGILARGQHTLDLTSDPVSADEPSTGTIATATTPTKSRQLVLYVHLSEDALRTHDPNAPVWVENAGGQLLTAAQIAAWCGREDTTRVVVRPVRDLAEIIHCDGYVPSAALAEQVRLRDRTCVFPNCTRPAGGCDLDHVIAYAAGGTTSSDNLACLCRLHHRLKTRGGWTYQMLELGVYLWRSPHGYLYRRDRDGTTDLTPKPVDPPDPPDQPGDPPDG